MGLVADGALYDALLRVMESTLPENDVAEIARERDYPVHPPSITYLFHSQLLSLQGGVTQSCDMSAIS